MKEKELKKYIDNRLVYWWHRLGLPSGYFCRRSFETINDTHMAEIVPKNLHGIYTFLFDPDKMIKESKRSVDLVVCHECLHVLLRERLLNLVENVTSTQVDKKTEDLIHKLWREGEERLCCTLADTLVSGGDINKHYKKLLKEFK